MLYGSLILIILRIFRMKPFTNEASWSDIPVLYVVMLFSLHHHGVAAAVRSVSVTACDDVSAVGSVNANCAAAHVLKIPAPLNRQQTNRSQDSTERSIQPTAYSHIRREIPAGNEW